MLARQAWPRAGPVAVLITVICTFFMLDSVHGAFCTPNSGTCWPDRATLNSWISTLSGATSVWLWDKTPEKFLSSSVTMNALKTNFPGIIVAPVSEKDLLSSLQFALRYKIRVVTRCSGHDYNGRSNGRGVMMIRMEKLDFVEYNPDDETVMFMSGATHEDVYSALAGVDRIFVGALSKSVCPAGCLAGGCHGLFSRRYGLGVESILEIRLMLYNGTTITATRNSNADLFHAYLGAGQNSFGVAVSFKAQTYPAPRQILRLEVSLYLYNPKLSGATSPNLFSEYIFNVRWFNSMPDELSGMLVFDNDVVFIRFFYTGGDYVGAFNALQPLLNSPYRRSVDPIVNYTSILDVVRHLQPDASELFSRSFFANAFLAPQPSMLNNLSRMIGETKPPMLLWLTFGAAVRSGSVGSVPAGMRSAMYEVLFKDTWFDPSEDELRMEYVSTTYLPALYSFGDSSYNNEYTTWSNLYNVLGDWKKRFFGDYDRLLRAKQKYDPCNYFTVKYGVASDLPSATC
ncbi:hypothetical protein VaNZ11_010134 [Volvox africanus]|uniref:FAD-binding PCMH-type domain-containing protein n=1 Tax=Volvox africanus TaxID=51714 RepID=A0ABQ5SAX6_9CHLO|nr:hypothetical protein VaNZ11_010134 [Volvox africanus]